MQDGILVVRDSNHELVGILTDGDFRRGCLTDDYDDAMVRDIMTSDPVSISENAAVAEAFNLMISRDINHLLIKNSAAQYSGLVSIHHLAKKMSPEQLFIDLKNHTFSENEKRHIARYHFAASFFSGKNLILDGACGCGYGSSILSSTGASVIGVDLNEKAIAYGIKNHSPADSNAGPIQFQAADLDTISFEEESLDGVVSLETLEHIELEACESYLSKAQRWIKPGGLLIASSPMLRFKNGKPFVTNPYHINEQKRSDLISMFKKLLPNFRLLFFHQKEEIFLPLGSENTGFCLLVARKSQ
jgi:2-polyprenyl-3-methyl-5-hydroxy-6-metoxy-1,4-benzoquinol methylase